MEAAKFALQSAEFEPISSVESVYYSSEEDEEEMSERRFAEGSAFEYEFDWDTNGLCHWLGTNCGIAQFQNPSLMAAIKVTSSEPRADSCERSAVLGREPVHFATKPTAHAFFAVRFEHYVVWPTRYTVRHSVAGDSEALRSWKLEGSCDGQKWTTIREHSDDKSLRRKGQSQTWPLPAARGYYSHFRLMQVDVNSGGNLSLALSGFEVYGAAARSHATMRWDTWAASKSKGLTVDTATNTVANGARTDKWQTVKAKEPLVFGSADGRCEFSVLTQAVSETADDWQFLAGIAPESFCCYSGKPRLGAQGSYAFIAGTGGKCHGAAKSQPYADLRCALKEAGDLVTVIVDIKAKTISFELNGTRLGVAFEAFAVRRFMHAAVSLRGARSALRLMQRVTPPSRIRVLPMDESKPVVTLTSETLRMM